MQPRPGHHNMSVVPAHAQICAGGLSVSKAVVVAGVVQTATPTLAVGDPFVYRLTAAASGASGSLVVRDALPAGVSLATATPLPTGAAA